MQLVYVYTTMYICFYYICTKYGHTQVVYHLSLIYLLMFMFCWVVEFDEECVGEMVREKPIVWLNLNLASLSQLETILSNCICEGVYWLRCGLVSKRSLLSWIILVMLKWNISSFDYVFSYVELRKALHSLKNWYFLPELYSLTYLLIVHVNLRNRYFEMPASQKLTLKLKRKKKNSCKNSCLCTFSWQLVSPFSIEIEHINLKVAKSFNFI